MKRHSVWTLAVAVLGFATAAQAGGAWRGALRQKIRQRVSEEIADAKQQIATLRQAVAEFFAAKDAGNRQAAMQAVQKARTAWQALPQSLRTRIEQKRPGTAERLNTLDQEFDLPDHQTATANSSGSVTGPAGQTVTREDTWTRDGNTITRDGTVAGPNGQTATIDGTISKDGNTLTRDTTVTGPGGNTAEQNVTWTKDGNKHAHPRRHHHRPGRQDGHPGGHLDPRWQHHHTRRHRHRPQRPDRHD